MVGLVVPDCRCFLLPKTCRFWLFWVVTVNKVLLDLYPKYCLTVFYFDKFILFIKNKLIWSFIDIVNAGRCLQRHCCLSQFKTLEKIGEEYEFRLDYTLANLRWRPLTVGAMLQTLTVVISTNFGLIFVWSCSI